MTESQNQYEKLIDNNLLKNIMNFKDVILLNKGVLLIISGGSGKGKTTTAGTIAKIIQPSFDMSKQVGRGVDQFSDAWRHTESMDLKSGEDVKVCIFDEAGTFNRKNSMTKLNKLLGDFFDTYRDARTLLMLCTTNFFKLDSSIYDSKTVQGLIYMYDNYYDENNKPVYATYGYFDTGKVLDMIDNKPRQGSKKYELTIPTKKAPNFRGIIKAPPDSFQGVVDHESIKGKLRLRKQVLTLAGSKNDDEIISEKMKYNNFLINR